LNESFRSCGFDIGEVARILRISRATLYQRIRIGAIASKKMASEPS